MTKKYLKTFYQKVWETESKFEDFNLFGNKIIGPSFVADRGIRFCCSPKYKRKGQDMQIKEIVIEALTSNKSLYEKTIPFELQGDLEKDIENYLNILKENIPNISKELNEYK